MDTSVDAEARIAASFAAIKSDPPAPAIVKLDLSNCRLEQLPSTLESESHAASRVTLLNLAKNALKTLPLLKTLPNLRILFLLSNEFTAVPPTLSSHESLTMLSFKQNNLKGPLPAHHLPPNLTWLILTSNSLTSLSMDFPSRCSRVRKLMLSNNSLTSLPPSFASEMTHLELLRLSNNNFTTFPREVLKLPRLKWLSLAGNPCTRASLSSAADLSLDTRVDVLAEAYEVDWNNPFGAGASGTAFPGVHRNSGRAVAVKRFTALKGSDGAALDEVAVTLAVRAVPGVVHAEAYSVETDGDGALRSVVLVTELVPGQAKCIAGPPSFDSCTRSVYDEGLELSRADAKRIVAVVEGAVNGLLEQGVAHGDVYGHNVLVGNPGDGGVHPVVLGDLGAAWWIPPGAREGARKIEMRAVDIFKEEVMSLVKE